MAPTIDQPGGRKKTEACAGALGGLHQHGPHQHPGVRAHLARSRPVWRAQEAANKVGRRRACKRLESESKPKQLPRVERGGLASAGGWFQKKTRPKTGGRRDGRPGLPVKRTTFFVFRRLISKGASKRSRRLLHVWRLNRLLFWLKFYADTNRSTQPLEGEVLGEGIGLSCLGSPRLLGDFEWI